MKKNIFLSISFAIILIACDSNIKTTSEPFPQIKALIQRQIPGYEDQFILDSIVSEKGMDMFEIESYNNKIILKGNNPVL